MQAIQSLILPQTMSPDDSSLPVQAGFTRAFSIASLYHFLSPFCLCSCLCFTPSSLRFTYLHYLVGCVTGVILVGRYGTSKQRAGGVVFLLGGYLWSSRTVYLVARWYVLRRLLA